MTAVAHSQFQHYPIQELPPSRFLSEEAPKIILQVLSPNTEDRRCAIQKMWDSGIFPTFMPIALHQIFAQSPQVQELAQERITAIFSEFTLGVAHFLEGLLSTGAKSFFDAAAFYKTCADSLKAVARVDIGEFAQR